MNTQATRVIRSVLCFVAIVQTGLLIPGDAWAKWPAPIVDRTYQQTLRIEFASPADAQAAQLDITPVPDGKHWAVSMRWDDSRKSNERMAELMARHDWPGTFFLNATDGKEGYIGTEYVKTLMVGGSDIGGHSQTHDRLPALQPNEIFYELLANRIEKETQADRPINAFAFPFGRYQSAGDPRAREAVAMAFLAAGYHHTVYANFVTDTPALRDAGVSASYETRPGDRNVDAGRFARAVEKLERERQTLQADAHAFYIGIHVSYRDGGWDDIESLIREYAHRDEWWYGTLTEYAAYAMQRHRAVIEKDGVSGTTATWKITRPVPMELGASVPMTVRVEGATPVAVASFDGGSVQNVAGDASLINLPVGDENPIPAVIDAIDNPTNDQYAAAVPNQTTLTGSLYLDESAKQLRLTLTNTSDRTLTGVGLTWRLPPMVADNVVADEIHSLGPGQSVTRTHALGPLRGDDFLKEGQAYFAVSCDVVQGGRASRLWLTTRLPEGVAGPLTMIRAAQMLGPVAGADPTPDALAGMSSPDAAMADLGNDPWMQWFAAGESDASRYARDRVTLYRYDKGWNKQMSSAINKPRDFYVAVNFTLNQAANLLVDSELDIAEVMLNGSAAGAADSLEGQEGANRLILRLKTKDDRSGYKPYPALLRITPAVGELAYLDPAEVEGIAPAMAGGGDGGAAGNRASAHSDDSVELMPPLSHLHLRAGSDTAQKSEADGVYRVQVKQPGAWYAAQLVQKPKGTWNPGDGMVLTLELRCTQGNGRAVVAMQQSVSPFAKSLREEVEVPSQWTTFRFPFKIDNTLVPGQSEVILGLGDTAQTVEVRRVSLQLQGVAAGSGPAAEQTEEPAPSALTARQGGELMPPLSHADLRAGTGVAELGFRDGITTVGVKHAGAWHTAQVVLKPTGSWSAGDTLSLQVELRATQVADESGEGWAVLAMQQSVSPFAKSLRAEWSIPQQWTTLQFPFLVGDKVKPGMAEVILGVGNRVQSLEIRRVSLVNHGKTPVGDLPRTQLSYAGREPDAAWRADAEKRIHQLRKADLTVLVVDADGHPVSDAQVSIQQTRHAFPFGSAVAADLLLGDTADAKAYQRFVEDHYNWVVLENNLKWHPWAEHRSRAMDALNWLNDRGIRARGHVLVWPSFKKMYYKAREYADDPQALLAYINAHVVDILGGVGGLVDQWDVLNEPYHNHDVMDMVGDQVMVDWFKLARQHNANAQLYINDFGILSGGGADTAHQDHYEKTIRYLLDNAAPLDGIGLQSHFLSTLTPPQRVLSLLDRFGSLGPRLMITELDIDAPSPELQADYLRDFLTVCFSHPKVDGVLMWGFWEGRHWRPNAALYNRDWSPRPAGIAWRNLVFEHWWTRSETQTNAEGYATARVFKGDYMIQIEGRHETITHQIDAVTKDSQVVIKLPTH